ncbi:MAG: MarC family protein [Candidatus Hydrothermae bacterium]|nr:MarC family protein [Candidatus Hydrothermae bacterium]
MNIGIFFKVFIALFVAIDFFGILPLFLSLTEGMSPGQRNKTLVESVLTALFVGLLFIVLGRSFLSFLGITIPDFQVAGGILLVTLSLADLLQREKTRRKPEEGIGAVPLGVPLIAGPAVITTLLVFTDTAGPVFATVAYLVNLAFLIVILYNSKLIVKFLGPAGSMALSKIMIIVMTAIGVVMARQGIAAIIGGRGVMR